MNQQAAGINLSSLPSPLSAFRNRAWSKASAPKLEFDEDEVSIESEGATRLWLAGVTGWRLQRR